ncbi:helix-turn-helix domain-containing protein [Alkalihalobacillus sp. NPDC078783]
MAVKFRAKLCLLHYILDRYSMTNAQLADLTGIAPSSLSSYANNHTIMNLETAMTVAEAIGCEVRDLYEWTTVKS